MSLVDRWLSRPMSQHVADGLRHEKPQNPASFDPMSQKSQMSQAASAGTSVTTPKAHPSQTEPKLLAPVSWYEHLGPPRFEGTPYHQQCLERRGRVERAGAALLHFCVVCGAWGSFGYGVTRDRPGLWYCGKHRPVGDLHPAKRGGGR